MRRYNKSYGRNDLDYTVESFESVGYPVSLGVYRKLLVGVAIGDTILEHQALEFSWPSLGHSVVVDPVVLFLDSTVRNRMRLKGEGWSARVQLEGSVAEQEGFQQKAWCHLVGHSSSSICYTWYAYTWRSYNALGQVLVEEFLGEQKACVQCVGSAGCAALPTGHSYASSCNAYLGWTCACDNAFGWGMTLWQDQGKWVAETKCGIIFPPGEVVATVVDQGLISVDINWSPSSGLNSNGGSIIKSCAVY